MNEFNVTFEQFKKVFDKIPGEPEFTIKFKNKSQQYMIIKYDGYVTFQRCSDPDNRGEIKYQSITSLYESNLIDDICLKRDWNEIETVILNETYDIRFNKAKIESLYEIKH